MSGWIGKITITLDPYEYEIDEEWEATSEGSAKEMALASFFDSMADRWGHEEIATKRLAVTIERR
jgi:hypothetical protein